jgi:hypothetical protein
LILYAKRKTVKTVMKLVETSSENGIPKMIFCLKHWEYWKRFEVGIYLAWFISVTILIPHPQQNDFLNSDIKAATGVLSKS